MSTEKDWTKEQINVGLAQRAWSYYYIHSSLRDSTTCYQPFFDLCADDVVWFHEGPQNPRVPTYPGEIRGKKALIEMLTWENDVVADLNLVDPIEKPIEYIASGDRVVVLIDERYRIIKTGVTVHNDRTAVVMDFRREQITNIRIIANLSDYIESQIGTGWAMQSS